jgi:TP901 family phage tail tape measure protein
MPLLSTLWVDIESRTSGLTTGLATAGTAVVAVGALATKMALDYSNAFTKISAVSNASASDIEKWRGEVLKLSGATAQAPTDLANALYFLASAGLKANQIMPVLKASAKAAAAGLGDVSDIAKLTSNVLNAYAGTGLQAANVTDILVAAVREGSANTDEFGTAIGRILPIASAAGISFDNVAASLSSLSNIGLDVNEGVTAMRGLLQALISPSSEAAGAMKLMGLSAQDILDSLQGEGLIATLRMLDETVRKTTSGQAEYMSVMRVLVPNVRALTGVLGLTQQQADKVDEVFKRVTDSSGSLDKAFKTTSESAGFKMRKALNDLKIIMIELGDKILPVVVAVIQGLEKEFKAWADMIEMVWGKLKTFGHNVAGNLQMMWDQFKEFIGNLGSFFYHAPDMLWNAGKDLLLGLWNGMKSMFSTIWNGLTGWVGGLVDHVKSFLHIGSPSKVFEEIGIQMMAGMDAGIQSGSNDVRGTLASFTPGMSSIAGMGAASGDLILKVGEEELGRIVRNALLKIGTRNVTTGIR